MKSTKSNIEWRTVGLIVFTYVSWILVGNYLYPYAPNTALILLTLLVAFHSSLVHEVLHGHPTKTALINELLISASLNLLLPYRRYKLLHLQHHNDERLTDPFDDPESYYKALYRYSHLSAPFRYILKLNNTMIGRFILGPLLSINAFIVFDLIEMVTGNRKIMVAWIIHTIATLPIIIALLLLFQIPIWQYFLFVIWPAFGLISIRTYAEHQWHEDKNCRTIIVENSILSFLFLNNNLHVVHHQNPTVAWYDLPKLYKDKKTHWTELNQGYVYQNYWQLIKQFAFTAKEPVAHPKWREKNELLRKHDGSK